MNKKVEPNKSEIAKSVFEKLQDDAEGSARHQKKHQTRRKILKSAYSLFREHGYEETNYTMIAKAASVGYGTVYAHFPNKDDLFFAQTMLLLNSYVDKFRGGDFLSASELPDNVIDRIIIINDKVWNLLALLPVDLLSRYMSHRWECDEQSYLNSNQARDQMLQVLESVLENAKTTGELKPDIDVKNTIFMIDAIFIKALQSARFNSQSHEAAKHQYRKLLQYLLAR